VRNNVTPIVRGYRPVRNDWREAVQTGALQKARSKRIAEAARRSRFGVRTILFPYAPVTYAAWSSVQIHNTFSRDDLAARADGQQRDTTARVTARTSRIVETPLIRLL
jgi:hypothetical protein